MNDPTRRISPMIWSSQRKTATTIIFLFLFSLFALSIQSVQAQDNLTISVLASENDGYTQITGTVTGPDQTPIEGAKVSIQVNNPSGKAAHLEFTYTDQNGQFEDVFKTPDGVNGEYTIYISASKAGYENGSAVTTFTAVPEFTTISLVAILSVMIALGILKKRISR